MTWSFIKQGKLVRFGKRNFFWSHNTAGRGRIQRQIVVCSSFRSYLDMVLLQLTLFQGAWNWFLSVNEQWTLQHPTFCRVLPTVATKNKQPNCFKTESFCDTKGFLVKLAFVVCHKVCVSCSLLNLVKDPARWTRFGIFVVLIRCDVGEV